MNGNGDAFTASNPALDAAIAKATSSEEIRELCKAYWERTGVIRRGNDYGQGEEVISQPGQHTISEPVMNSGAQTYSRHFYIINDAYTVYGESVDELDTKEQRIRAMFGGSR